jgi:dihydrodipicolinate reductase
LSAKEKPFVKVVIVGATKEIGRKAIQAVSKARGMELAGAIDSQCIGQDAGEVLTINSASDSLRHSTHRDAGLQLGPYLVRALYMCWHCSICLFR